MTSLAALADRGQWGAQLCVAAAARGWRTQLFDSAQQVAEADYGFFRIHQHPTHRTESDKVQAYELIMRGVKPIPDYEQIRLYDDKLAQSGWEPMRRFMPRTLVARSIDEALRAASSLTFPIISKSAAGSASAEMRLLKNGADLERELTAAFGAGIRNRYATQQGYVIFQQFLERNAYDYRVCAIGRQRMMLRRLNRDDRPFASGSGKCVPITELDAETGEVLDVADEFFRAVHTSWCGIDLVKDPETGWWRVLEVTLAWTQKAYAECAFFGTDRKGAEIWSVLLDEIEAGVFG